MVARAHDFEFVRGPYKTERQFPLLEKEMIILSRRPRFRDLRQDRVYYCAVHVL